MLFCFFSCWWEKWPFGELGHLGKMSRVLLGFHVVSHFLQRERSDISEVEVCKSMSVFIVPVLIGKRPFVELYHLEKVRNWGFAQFHTTCNGRATASVIFKFAKACVICLSRCWWEKGPFGELCHPGKLSRVELGFMWFHTFCNRVEMLLVSDWASSCQPRLICLYRCWRERIPFAELRHTGNDG